MASVRFSDDEWQRIWAHLKEHRGIYVNGEAPTRGFVEAVLWMARSGAPWSLLPAEFGSWNSVYKRFARRLDQWGQEKGVWQLLIEHLSADGDLEWLMLDSTVVRAHSSAGGAKKAKETSWPLTRRLLHEAACAWRRPRGNSLRFTLTAGQAGHAPEAIALLATIAMVMVEAVLADRAYDGDAIFEWIIEQEAVPVIPQPIRPAPAPARPIGAFTRSMRGSSACLAR